MIQIFHVFTIFIAISVQFVHAKEIEIVGWIAGETADSSMKTAQYLIDSLGVDLEIEVLLNEKVRVLKHSDSTITGLISFDEFCNSTNIPHRVKYVHYPFPDHVMNTFKSLPPHCYKFKSKFRITKTYSSSTETYPFADILINGKYQLLTKLPKYEKVNLFDPITGVKINPTKHTSNQFNNTLCQVPSKEVVQLFNWTSNKSTYSVNTGYFEMENGDYSQDYGFGCKETKETCECHHLDKFWERLGDAIEPFITNLLNEYEQMFGIDTLCQEFKPKTVFLDEGSLVVVNGLMSKKCKWNQ